MLAPFLGLPARRCGCTSARKHRRCAGQSHAEDAYRFTADSLYIPADRVQIIETTDGYRIEGARRAADRRHPAAGPAVRPGEHRHDPCRRGRLPRLRGPPAGLGRCGQDQHGGQAWWPCPACASWPMTGRFLGADGMLMGYAKPMFIKPHHRSHLPGHVPGRPQAAGPGLADESGGPSGHGRPSGHCPLSEDRRLHPALVPGTPHGPSGARFRHGADLIGGARPAGDLPRTLRRLRSPAGNTQHANG